MHAGRPFGVAQAGSWARASLAVLTEYRHDIDAINVYPVADSDTGSNMAATVRGAVDALDALPAAPADAAELLAALASGAVHAARGNSGVILSQVLRAFAVPLGGGTVHPGDVHAALDGAARLARSAVSVPQEGTVLTVLRAVAGAVTRREDGDVAETAAGMVRVALTALAATTEQLPELRAARVVDAGAVGLVLVLRELAVTLGADVGPVEDVLRLAANRPQLERNPVQPYAYEVMYLLTEARADSAVTVLRGALGALGDSVTLAGDGHGRWRVHVHCDDVGAAIEAGVDAGRPRDITVVRFADTPAPPTALSTLTGRAVVALVRGPGAAELFRSAGAYVVAVGQDSAPEPEVLRSVLRETGAAQVSVLCPQRSLLPYAEHAAGAVRAEGQSVVVVPVSSEVQGIAALAVHDASRRAEDDVVAMAEAAAATLRGALTMATEAALTWAGACEPGDVLGTVAEEVVLVESDRPGAVPAAACRLLDHMLASGGELVTGLLGAAAEPDLAPAIAAHVRAAHPGVELAVYPGGQQDTVLRLGVE